MCDHPIKEMDVTNPCVFCTDRHNITILLIYLKGALRLRIVTMIMTRRHGNFHFLVQKWALQILPQTYPEFISCLH